MVARGVAEPSDQRGDHGGGVSADPAEGVGGEGALVFQAEVDQAQVGGRDPACVQRCAAWVEGAEAAEVAEAGAVAGGQDDRIGPLALAWFQTTWSPSRPANIGRTSSKPSARVCWKPTLSVITLPPVILSSHSAGSESNPVSPSQWCTSFPPIRCGMNRSGCRAATVTCGQGGQLVGHLGGGVARTDHDDPLPGVRGRVPVVGDMDEFAGEALLTWEGRAIRAGERAAGRDDPRGPQPPPVCRHDHELTVFLADGRHPGAGADLHA